jgi:hypothetical protein
MSSPDVRQNMYQQKINTMLNEVNSIKSQLSETESRVYSLDEVISKLPTRIANVRQMNYKIQMNFEADQIKAAERWASIGQSIKFEVGSKAASLRMEITALERDVGARRNYPSFDMGGLNGLDLRILTQKMMVQDISKRTQEALTPVYSVLNPLKDGLSVAESVVNLTSAVSFQWRGGETPVVAVRAKDMNKNVDGILTLSNQRFIYESEKEIVLKKTFFIVTEKKKERQLVIETPIGSLSKITKGRVGLLEGAGLYIEFKQQTESQMKLDTKGEEADLVIKYYGLITSGQIDEELRKIHPSEEKSIEPKILSCPKCGAPYSEEVYRGQMTVQCKYCNTMISVNN